MRYEQVNKQIADHTTMIKAIFFSDRELESKLVASENTRQSLIGTVEAYGLSGSHYSLLVDKMLLLLGQNGVSDIRIEGQYIFVDVDGRNMDEQDNVSLFGILQNEGFVTARIKTRKWKQQENCKDLLVVQFPKMSKIPTKYYSKQEGAKAHGY